MENNKFEDKVKSLEGEVHELRKKNIDYPGIHYLESENRNLEIVIRSMKGDQYKIVNDLKESNQNLKMQVENLLKCDDCDDIFSDKALLFNHIKQYILEGVH